MSQRQITRAAFLLIDSIDVRSWRSVPACFDHRTDHRGRSRKHRLHGAVPPIANPAFETASARRLFGPRAVAYPLHVAANDEPANGLRRFSHSASLVRLVANAGRHEIH